MPLKGQFGQKSTGEFEAKIEKALRLLQLCAEPAYKKIEKSVSWPCPFKLAMLYTIFLHIDTGVKQLVPIPQLMTRWRYPFLQLQLQ